METVSAFLIACVMIGSGNPTLKTDTVIDICESVEYHAQQSKFDPSTIVGLIWVESRFDPAAVSRSNARGVMQVIIGRSWSPDYTNEDMLDPWLSVEAGIGIAEKFRRRHPKDWLECYNAGNSCDAPSYAKAVKRVAKRHRALQSRVHNALSSGQ